MVPAGTGGAFVANVATGLFMMTRALVDATNSDSIGGIPGNVREGHETPGHSEAGQLWAAETRALEQQAPTHWREWLSHEDRERRLIAATYLAGLNRCPPDGVTPLIARLMDTEWDIRRQAALGLAHIRLSDAGGELAVQALVAAVDDQNAIVRVAALRSLGRLGRERPDAVAALQGIARAHERRSTRDVARRELSRQRRAGKR